MVLFVKSCKNDKIINHNPFSQSVQAIKYYTTLHLFVNKKVFLKKQLPIYQQSDRLLQ